MLSRVADTLYWMSRYLERVEHTARLLDVNLNQMLDQQTEHVDQRWKRLRSSLHMPPITHEAESKLDAYTMTQELTFDASQSASILSCIDAARENARQVREQISSEMWEHVNRLFLQIKRTSIEDMWYAEPHTFLTSVKEGVQLVQGLTDATMHHSEGWQFIRLGRFIERASATATLLDVHACAFRQKEDKEHALDPDAPAQLDYLGWVGLLRSCAAFEAYCKVYLASIQPDHIIEFLLLNPESPRSIRFASVMIQNTLQAIGKSTGMRHAGRVERLAGRFRAALDYDQIEEIMGSMHAYLENIQRQCTQIDTATYQVYVAYPIDAALIA